MELHGQTIPAAKAEAPITGHTTDAIILQLATAQHGVVARWQLRHLGIPLHRIDYRLKSGWLEPLHSAIYRVARSEAPRQREMAAILACGPDSVLSHQSAGALQGMLSPAAHSSTIFVTTTRDVRLRAMGIYSHRVGELPDDELTRLDGIPLTNPARTLLDLAAAVGMRELERILARSERQRLLERGEVERLLLRYPRRRGVVQLRALIESGTDPLHTRSEAEERFLTLVRKAALPSPEMNVFVHGFEVDALWRRERLVVEVDGFAFHSSPAAFERDRYRDGVLVAAGFRIMRVTWQQLTEQPESLLVRLTKALVVRT